MSPFSLSSAMATGSCVCVGGRETWELTVWKNTFVNHDSSNEVWADYMGAEKYYEWALLRSRQKVDRTYPITRVILNDEPLPFPLRPQFATLLNSSTTMLGRGPGVSSSYLITHEEPVLLTLPLETMPSLALLPDAKGEARDDDIDQVSMTSHSYITAFYSWIDCSSMARNLVPLRITFVFHLLPFCNQS